MNRRVKKTEKDFMKKIIAGMKDEGGMGVIEVVLIIVVLVGLALIFKKQITSIANGLFGTVKDQISSFS